MENHYALADLKGKDNLLTQISKYEQELAREMGGDIALIAYLKDKHYK